MNLRAETTVGGRSNHAELSEKGKRQAILAGKWLVAHHIIPDTIITSPAKRTIATATASHEQLFPHRPLTLHIDDRLQELSQGIMDGQPRIDAWTPDIVARLQQDPMNFAFPEGESSLDVQQRMQQSYNDLVQAHPNKTVLVAGHGLAIRLLVGALEQWSHAKILATDMPNCGLTLIEQRGDTPTIRYVGRDIVGEQLAYDAEKV